MTQFNNHVPTMAYLCRMFEGDKKIVKNSEENFKAVLIAVISSNQSEEQAIEYLDELAFLAQTAGVDSVKYFTQNLESPNSRSFVGSGKLEEISNYVEENEIDFIIFDDELSPSQVNNIEKLSKGKILDRSDLILFIFEKRAQTAQSKLQVELAQLQYTLPRLKKKCGRTWKDREVEQEQEAVLVKKKLKRTEG